MRCRSRQTGVGRAALVVVLLLVTVGAVLVGGTATAGALDRGPFPQATVDYPPAPPVTVAPRSSGSPTPSVAPSSDSGAAAAAVESTAGATDAPAEVLGESENRAGRRRGPAQGSGGRGRARCVGGPLDRGHRSGDRWSTSRRDGSPSSAGLSALLILLLLAASQLFNDALKNHHDEIVRQLADRTTILGRLA